MPLTETDKLILHLIRTVPDVGRTQVMKFLYLVDLRARQYTGKPVTDLNYVWYDYGPFDSAVYASLERLEKEGHLLVDTYPSRGSKGYWYRAKPGAEPQPPALSPGQAAIAQQVTDTIRTSSLDKLLGDLVYQSVPMRDAKERQAMGEPLRMDLVDGEMMEPGLDLDDAWEGYDQVQAGKLIPHNEVFRRLRSV